MGILDAIDHVYRVFARYPLRKDMESCPCCIRDSEKHDLGHVALRELNVERLSRYAFKAITTWGEVVDYKHFVPRILELAAMAPASTSPGIELELVASKLHRGQWTSWPEPERKALCDYFDALWLDTLSRNPAHTYYSATEVFRACAHATNDPTRFLEAWTALSSFSSHLHLASTIVEQARCVVGDDQRKPPWRSPDHHAALVAWLQGPTHALTLRRAFEVNVEDPQSTLIAESIDVLEQVDDWRIQTIHHERNQ